MCTLIVLDRVLPRFPIVVGSNRDEYLSRPAAPPTKVTPERKGRPAFVAPQDLEAGGSWMGVNEHGVFVGLTNRPTEERRPHLRSRGLLVIDALGQRNSRMIARAMSQELEGRYNPFNLLHADGRETRVTILREGGAETRELEPGLHVLCNRDIDDLAAPKIAAIREQVDRLDLEAPLDRVVAGLGEVLRTHGQASTPLEHVCVHTPAYGTRSSSILAIGDGRWGYWYADGRPCESKYRNFSTLLDDLRQNSQSSRYP